MATKQTVLHLTVRTREGVVFNDTVVGVSSINERGKFDVVERHANFISLLNAPIVIHKSDGGEQTIQADNAIIRVKNDQVDIYLGISTGLR